MGNPQLRNGELQFTSPRWSICKNYLEDLSLLPCVSIDSVISIIVDSWILILYIVIQFGTTVFSCSDCLSFGHWEFFQLALAHTRNLWVLFFFFFFKHFLSGTTRCSRVVLYISTFSSKISHFSKKLRFHLLEYGIRKQDQGAGSACCFWGVLRSVLSQLTQNGHICVCTNLCIYPYLCIFL